MAELDGLRIYALADTQASYSSGLFLPVDDAGFTNTKKIAISTIYPLIDTLSAAGDFNPATSVLRLNNGSGDETKVTVNDMLEDSDVVDTIKLLGNTGWKTYLAGDVVKDSTKVDANSFIVNTISTLGIVTLTGIIQLNSVPSINEDLFTLPSEIPTATQDIHFSAGDDSGNDENYQLYIPAGSRTIKAYTNNSSSGTAASFCATFIAI